MQAFLNRAAVIIATSIVSAVGLLTLVSLIFGNVPYAIPETSPIFSGARGIIPTGIFAIFFVRIAVLTLAFSIIIGIINLILVNANRAVQGATHTAKVSSILVLVSFVAGLTFPILSSQGVIPSEWNTILLENVQTTIESALAGLLFFALVYGAFRMMRQKVTPAAMLFIFTVEIVLIGALPVAAIAPLQVVTDWIINVPVNAGARGILLGIGLATLLTGLRVLIGQDREYGE